MTFHVVTIQKLQIRNVMPIVDLHTSYRYRYRVQPHENEKNFKAMHQLYWDSMRDHVVILREYDNEKEALGELATADVKKNKCHLVHHSTLAGKTIQQVAQEKHFIFFKEVVRYYIQSNQYGLFINNMFPDDLLPDDTTKRAIDHALGLQVNQINLAVCKILRVHDTENLDQDSYEKFDQENRLQLRIRDNYWKKKDSTQQDTIKTKQDTIEVLLAKNLDLKELLVSISTLLEFGIVFAFSVVRSAVPVIMQLASREEIDVKPWGVAWLLLCALILQSLVSLVLRHYKHYNVARSFFFGWLIRIYRKAKKID